VGPRAGLDAVAKRKGTCCSARRVVIVLTELFRLLCVTCTCIVLVDGILH
jgi:hypothetical protein